MTALHDTLTHEAGELEDVALAIRWDHAVEARMLRYAAARLRMLAETERKHA